MRIANGQSQRRSSFTQTCRRATPTQGSNNSSAKQPVRKADKISFVRKLNNDLKRGLLAVLFLFHQFLEHKLSFGRRAIFAGFVILLYGLQRPLNCMAVSGVPANFELARKALQKTSADVVRQADSWPVRFLVLMHIVLQEQSGLQANPVQRHVLKRISVPARGSPEPIRRKLIAIVATGHKVKNRANPAGERKSMTVEQSLSTSHPVGVVM
jgi:hypothetical protein